MCRSYMQTAYVKSILLVKILKVGKSQQSSHLNDFSSNFVVQCF